VNQLVQVPTEVSLQLPRSAPPPPFDTKSEAKTSEELSSREATVVTELESTSAESPAPPLKANEPLTGWAMLQARLTRSAPQAAATAPAKSELLSYGETHSYSAPSAAPTAEEGKAFGKKESRRDAESEANLFAYISGKSERVSAPPKARPKLGKIFLFAALVLACVGVGAVPQARLSVQTFYRKIARTGTRLLNPPPAPLPQTVALHDSFGQSGDEYKLPVPANIPDATTDPSQIRVLPMLDPTAKPQKNPEATPEEQVLPVENPSASPDQTAPGQTAPGQTAEEHTAENDVKDSTPANVADVPKKLTETHPDAAAPPTNRVSNTPSVQLPAPKLPATSVVPRSVPQHSVSASVRAGIPSSLRSQLASTTPLSSGNKPLEAAMSSIEPVYLPEPVARQFLFQPVDPVYPSAAKASGQRGSVVLQVLIGRDGTVQDAKFLQGSLVFARVAIDAVKQYRFKPYSLNGRPVSVQSVMTLNFNPPA
jgi:protein TonB